MSDTYNGWTNYQTWVANLWLNKNQMSRSFLESAKDVSEDIYDQAEWLKEQMSIQLRDEIDTPCLWHDLLQAAFGEIDWVELALNI